MPGTRSKSDGLQPEVRGSSDQVSVVAVISFSPASAAGSGEGRLRREGRLFPIARSFAGSGPRPIPGDGKQGPEAFLNVCGDLGGQEAGGERSDAHPVDVDAALQSAHPSRSGSRRHRRSPGPARPGCGLQEMQFGQVTGVEVDHRQSRPSGMTSVLPRASKATLNNGATPGGNRRPRKGLVFARGIAGSRRAMGCPRSVTTTSRSSLTRLTQ